MGTKKQRRAYTTADFRDTLATYTEGDLQGKEVAAMMGRTYGSFIQFVKRHPELKKRAKC